MKEKVEKNQMETESEMSTIQGQRVVLTESYSLCSEKRFNNLQSIQRGVPQELQLEGLVHEGVHLVHELLHVLDENQGFFQQTGDPAQP